MIQLLVLVGLGLCPGSLLLGFLGAIWLVRQLGIRWPWEQTIRSAECYHHVRFEVDESGNGDVMRIVRQLERRGFSLVSECHLGWDKKIIVTMKKRVR